MTSLLDSQPTFEARLIACGVTDAHRALLVNARITTMARLAWSSNAVPGVGSDADFVSMIERAYQVAPGTLEDVSPGALSCIRRVWFEAHTVGVAEVRARVERTDESASRRLPVPARAAKLDAHKLRLFGVSITGPILPSHCLIDFVMNMREDEQLKYVDPELCTAREQELTGHKPSSTKADMSTEHRVRLALQRRSLALDQADLMLYSVSEAYHDFLFSLLSLPVPSDYRAIDIPQILTADRAIWARMNEHCAAGISVRPDGSKPMELALVQARLHPLVTCLISPLQQTTRGPKPKLEIAKKAKSDRGGKSKPKEGKGKAKGKSKSKDGKGRSAIRMPYDLIGCHSQTADGSKICFDCNLAKGCSRTVTDGKCSAGMHVCCGCLSTSHLYQGCS